MKQELADLRMPSDLGQLNESDLTDNPMELFSEWFEQAIKASSHPQPNAMNLSTNGTNGFPQSRIVLLKAYTDKDFIFYTNYKSQKGIGIAFDNKVTLNFYWPDLERSIRIEGLAEKTSDAESDAYFNRRPLESRYNAIVSSQSQKIKSREELFEAIEQLKIDLKGKAPKRPGYWGGYRILPLLIEFWQGRDFRLHDRIVYQKNKEGWTMSRLAP